MRRPLRLEIVTPHQLATLQQVPVGFSYLDEMFREAGWADEASRLADAEEATWIRRVQRRFQRPPYRGRVDVRLVSLWSLLGLWRSVRFGLRTYPACVIAGRQAYTDGDLGELEKIVQAALVTSVPEDESVL